MTSKTVPQRAFELARSGRYARWNAVAKCLRDEGYFGVTSHFSGIHLRRQINELCLAAQTAAEAAGEVITNEGECWQASETLANKGDILPSPRTDGPA